MIETLKSLPKIVVFGEALTDFIIQENGHYDARPGGACWNVARVTARLGVPTGFAGSVSYDLFGAELHRLALEAGCDPRFIQQYEKAPLLAMVTQRHPPHYFFIGNDSADLAFDPEKLPEDWLKHVEWLHFGCISLVRNPLADTLLKIAFLAFNRGIKISFDPNWRAIMEGDRVYYDRFIKLAAISSIIKVSDEDLSHLFKEYPSEQHLSLIRERAPYADILHTLGEKGMTLITKDNEVYKQPILPTSVQDTVGAGDASIGGFLASQVHSPDASPEIHLRFAAAAACYACQKSGAYAPSLEEVNKLLGLI